MRMSAGRLFAYGILVVVGVFSCKKDDPEPSAPLVTTVGLTDITDSSVKAGGRITSTGNDEIIATGFCWSTLTTNPTIADDTSVSTNTSSTFVLELTNLDPSTTYYIRAYAINSIGIGYGDTISFNTGNAPPKIEAIMVEGNTVVDSILSATYTYSDFENDPDSASSFQWYNALDTVAGSGDAIAGADSATYKVAITDTTKFIRVGVTPVAASGSILGEEVRSAWFGPVRE
ncbi:MAG: hypothetical protein JNK79_19240 [Chitinophagaceae bacterium]|nr:hypothetical protein [Chitinophagaceae bacterium]